MCVCLSICRWLLSLLPYPHCQQDRRAAVFYLPRFGFNLMKFSARALLPLFLPAHTNTHPTCFSFSLPAAHLSILFFRLYYFTLPLCPFSFFHSSSKKAFHFTHPSSTYLSFSVSQT
uniref:Putative secreted protein n=1 Tax=Panstrongylus lignarius TaxID=156445 RepID=A0A224Y0J4_9HEMI